MKRVKKSGKCPFKEKGNVCEVSLITGNGDKHFTSSKDPEDSKAPVVCSCWNKDLFTRKEEK